MQNRNKRQSYLLKESALQNEKYGWVNELTGEWEIDPIYDYYYAINFDFQTYLNEMKRIKAKRSDTSKPKQVEEEVYSPMKIEDMSIELLRQNLEDARKDINILEFDLSISDDVIRGLRAECKRLEEYNESLKSIINKYINNNKNK